MKLELNTNIIAIALAVAGVALCIYLIYKVIFLRNDVRISWRNVLRNKRRNIITLGAVAFALTGNILLGNYFLSQFYGLRESVIRSETGHLQILKKGYLTYGSSAPGEYVVEDPDKIIARINAHTQLHELVTTMTKEIRFNGIVTSQKNDRSLNYIARGVEVKQDRVLSTYDTYTDGSPLSDRHPYSIVLGKGLAAQLEVKSGDEVTLLSSLFDGGLNVMDGTVQGIVRAFSEEYGKVIVKTSLEYAQEMVGSDQGANKIVILIDDTKNTLIAKDMVQEILSSNPEWQDLQVYDWLELADFYSQVHTLYNNIYAIVSGLLFGLIIFLVVNTMTMNIYERFNEFGTVRSIGLKKRQLVDMVLTEGIILGLIGTFIGILITIGIGEVVDRLDITYAAPPGQSADLPLELAIYPSVSGYVKLAIMSILSIIGLTALATLFPGIKAAKLKIIDAIHTV